MLSRTSYYLAPTLLLLLLVAIHGWCTVSAIEPSIVGGSEAPPFRYTNWTVGLLHPSEYSFYGKRPFCGAAYIGKNVVLTAAHCLFSIFTASEMWVEAQRHDWSDTREQGLRMIVTSITKHPKYNRLTSENDIAVIRVTGGPELLVYPELDDGQSSDESQPREFKVLGWGATAVDGKESSKLLEGEVELVPSARCKALYEPTFKVLYPEVMICAGKPGVDTCQGDSGGPMFVDQSIPVVVGLTSWGIGCGRSQPGVYSRISSLRAFIDDEMGCTAGTSFSRGKCRNILPGAPE